ncbi:hypothetical protein LTR37_005602 [Vermiconidia calcicola]|uniref:Uncharacterized protein n=1 Tax=Vermiconidia calcicola TaxID=1690605 RepID=A0ACC3NKA9_9PEZI|nr:hypothetical protein LTR37_005602 [Vermiconidia calcicola]
MVLAKSKNAVGLGNSLMNDRFKSQSSNMHRTSHNAPNTPSPHSGTGITRTDQAGNKYVTPAKKEAEWTKLRSVTEQGALDEFLSTAELAGTDFTAEKMNGVKIIHREQKNPYLLTREEERRVVRKMDAKRGRLTVPRRPKWDKHTTAGQLDERERESLLDWRRGLAELQEQDDLLMTPFERNLEVWRQLWRVIERSDLVVQIVDARNPLLFRCEDLERYVKEVDAGKRNLLLVNKADMMTEGQRREWARWFGERGVNYRFFSAELAREMNEAREGGSDSEESEGVEVDDGSAEEDGVLNGEDVEEEVDPERNTIAHEAAKIDLQDEQEEDDQWVDEESLDPEPHPDRIKQEEPTAEIEVSSMNLPFSEQTRILTTEDLETLFLQHSPQNPTAEVPSYPNVGKSSTINALLGAKKVSVSATPGKTKHFQTIHLSPRVILCDCPGLVFPNFATTKAELVCAGVLPIDQLREYTGPAALVAQRIPQGFLEAIYGMRIQLRPVEEGGTGEATGEEVLRAYARARGFWTQGLGQPDESRAARTVLKDYVKGKLLFVHPPPREEAEGKVQDGREFNRELYDLAHLHGERKRRAHLSDTASEDPSLMDDPSSTTPTLPGAPLGTKGKKLDTQFFAPGQGNGIAVQPFHYKYSEQGAAGTAGGGKALSGRKLKAVKALEQDVDPSEVKGAGKKHFKGGRRATGKGKKERGQVASGWRGDYD